MRLSLLSALCVAKKKAVNDHRPVDRLRYKESTEAFFLQIKNNNKILIKILGFNHSIFRAGVKQKST
jgi:hypothetical protein